MFLGWSMSSLKESGKSFDPQYQQKIEEIVAVSKDQGYITYEEINDILPMTFDSADEIDQILIFLSGMDVQLFSQAEIEKQKERKKEAKEAETSIRRSDTPADDPVRMYLKEMGSVPLLSREEEVEITKRIKKEKMQIEKIIMRFRFASRETISIIVGLIAGKDRYDKIVSEKEIEDKSNFFHLMPKLQMLLKKEDDHFAQILQDYRREEISKVQKLKLAEEIEKSRIRTQAYLRRMHFRYPLIEDFGEVILMSYDQLQFLH